MIFEFSMERRTFKKKIQASDIKPRFVNWFSSFENFMFPKFERTQLRYVIESWFKRQSIEN